MKTVVAAIQITSTTDTEANLTKACGYLRQAADTGAKIAALPENWLYMRGPGDPPPAGVSLDGPELEALRSIASNERITVLAGTVPEAIPGNDKVYNTSVLIGTGGSTVAIYRKIHLFDVSLSPDETHNESAGVEPGNEVVLANTSFGMAGLTVCYDLRFPELYRALAFGGAKLIFVPAAFTTKTGPPHWEVLLRARAIENQCYVVAAGQCGQNTPLRATHGHSMIIAPWGDVLAAAAGEETIVTAEIDTDEIDRVRAELPSLKNVRDWLL